MPTYVLAESVTRRIKIGGVCAEVFSGNSIDASSYEAFIRDNEIRHEIIISDKGFPHSKIADELKNRPDLHFLTPIRRTDVRIRDNDMLSFTEPLKGVDGHILYKKCQLRNGRFLYSFRDAGKAADEEVAFLCPKSRQEDFSAEIFGKKRESFGVIVFGCRP